MKTQLAIINTPTVLTKKQNKTLRRAAKKRLGRKFRVLVVSGGADCRIVSLREDS